MVHASIIPDFYLTKEFLFFSIQKSGTTATTIHATPRECIPGSTSCLLTPTGELWVGTISDIPNSSTT